MAKYLNFSITGYKKTDYFCIINLTSDERKLGMPVLNRYEQPVFCACFPFRKFFFSETLQCRAAATFSKEKLPVSAELIRVLKQNIMNSFPGKFPSQPCDIRVDYGTNYTRSSWKP